VEAHGLADPHQLADCERPVVGRDAEDVPDQVLGWLRILDQGIERDAEKRLDRASFWSRSGQPGQQVLEHRAAADGRRARRRSCRSRA
jgi:hypothetical protein